MWEKDRGLQWWHKCLFHILEVWHAAVPAHWRLHVLLFYCIKHCSYVVHNRCRWLSSLKHSPTQLKPLSYHLILCIPLLQGTGFTLTLGAWGARNYMVRNFQVVFSGLRACKLWNTHLWAYESITWKKKHKKQQKKTVSKWEYMLKWKLNLNHLCWRSCYNWRWLRARGGATRRQAETQATACKRLQPSEASLSSRCRDHTLVYQLVCAVHVAANAVCDLRLPAPDACHSKHAAIVFQRQQRVS